MKARFFQSQIAFRKWLDENHEREPELLVGFYKVNSAKLSMTWSESVDQALCFGWIDGIRRKIDEESYSIRFTPRRAKSVWSAVNIKKVAELIELDLMKPAGIAAFEKRDEDRSRIYAYERKAAKLSTDFENQFKEVENAWTFFNEQPAGYKKLMIYWIMSAKQKATRERRLAKLIDESAKGKRI